MTTRRIYCDFHGLVADATYALDTQGTREDLQKTGIVLTPGLTSGRSQRRECPHVPAAARRGR